MPISLLTINLLIRLWRLLKSITWRNCDLTPRRHLACVTANPKSDQRNLYAHKLRRKPISEFLPKIGTFGYSLLLILKNVVSNHIRQAWIHSRPPVVTIVMHLPGALNRQQSKWLADARSAPDVISVDAVVTETRGTAVFVTMLAGAGIRPFPAQTAAATPQQNLCQYYTRPEIAEMLFRLLKNQVDLRNHLIVEPTAGAAAFLRLFPAGGIGFDIDPRDKRIWWADFFGLEIYSDRPLAFVGNPPFSGSGKHSYVEFFNHAAEMADIVAMILPRSARKASVQNRFNRHFHLLHEADVPKDAYIYGSDSFDAPTVFQIWRRCDHLRPLRPTATTHCDFDFTTEDQADFAVQRVGSKAGKVHTDFQQKRSTHYFIRAHVPGVEEHMRSINFAEAARDTAAIKSLAKSEIVALYGRSKAEDRIPQAASSALGHGWMRLCRPLKRRGGATGPEGFLRRGTRLFRPRESRPRLR